MGILIDIPLTRTEDAYVYTVLEPPTPVGSWSTQFFMTFRPAGVSGLINKWFASGFNNVSGTQIVDSGKGIFLTTIAAADTSGLTPGNFYYQHIRLDSGSRTIMSEGYVLLQE